MTYQDFIAAKTHEGADHGFEPTWMPDILFPFQRALVEWSVRKGRAAIFADCGLGKGQPRNAMVLTPTGWKQIGNLTKGDSVIASDGKAYAVTGVYEKPEQDTYRVHFSDGSSYVVDLDHQHICRTNNDRQLRRKWRVLSTAELLQCKNLRYGCDGKSRNYDIPVVADVMFTPQQLAIDPYVLGVLLGDGHVKGSIKLSAAEEQIRNEVTSRLPVGVALAHSSKNDYNIVTGHTGNRRHPFRQAFHDMGLLGNLSADKFIPRNYLLASPYERLELLRGLMDTDGYCDRGGTSQFYSVSGQLADGVMFLVRSLGGVPTRSMKQTACNGVKGQPCHVITFSLATHNPFRLKRKAERWNEKPRDNGRWIDRIEFERRQPTVCISVASPDSSYVTEDFIVTHNTFCQLTWAENVARKTGGRVLILTPLSVAFQTVNEGVKCGVEVEHRREGIKPGDRIVVTNYERLHHFNADDFAGVVCDESSILKNFDGATRLVVTDFMRKRPYRLLCTATAAPNDYIELGTSSEALGGLGASDMISRFFRKTEATTTARQERMAGIYRLRPHATHDFWRWVCSWARALRRPSDMGFDDGGFALPTLNVRSHCVRATTPRPGYLFDLPAVGLAEQRTDLRHTITERCEMVAALVNAHKRPVCVWCNLIEEGHRLRNLIPDAVEVEGSDSEEFKEESFSAFINGQIRVLVTKPTIAGFGLNFQHCADTTYFPSHSYEQYYQSVRRFWRFGQKLPVTVDMVTTDGQEDVVRNLNRKTKQADEMFERLTSMMWKEMRIERQNTMTQKARMPVW